jgi:hypothetical protein
MQIIHIPLFSERGWTLYSLWPISLRLFHTNTLLICIIRGDLWELNINVPEWVSLSAFSVEFECNILNLVRKFLFWCWWCPNAKENILTHDAKFGSCLQHNTVLCYSDKTESDNYGRTQCSLSEANETHILEWIAQPLNARKLCLKKI